MSSIEIPVIAGDGIGPEITAAVLKVVEAAAERNGSNLSWVPVTAGLSALEEGSDLIPQRTLDEISRCGVALKGPCTTPVGEGFTSINVKLRKTFNLYAAVRPVRSMPGVQTRYQDVDLIIIRENTEGLYSGVENEVTPGVVMSMKVASKEACQRIATWAFRFANRRERKKVTVLHKANIMKLTDGLFLKCAADVHAVDYPNIAFESTIIDAGCMKLVQDPSQFDVLLLENLYGDVISDLCAGLVGGLGVVPGANIGQDLSIFEAVHGSAPDIAGQNIANPLALLMSSVMMLNFLAETRQAPALAASAELIRKAYDACLISGEKTKDLGGQLGTSEFADAVITRL
mgnify:FL=1